MNLPLPGDLPHEASTFRPVPSDFDEVINEGNVLVVFWTRACRGCVELLHALEFFSAIQGGRLRVLTADMSQQEALGDRFRVLTLPTMLFFQHGQLLSVKVGAQSPEELHDWLNPFVVSR